MNWATDFTLNDLNERDKENMNMKKRTININIEINTHWSN